jgi:hypothetical protein
VPGEGTTEKLSQAVRLPPLAPPAKRRTSVGIKSALPATGLYQPFWPASWVPAAEPPYAGGSKPVEICAEAALVHRKSTKGTKERDIWYLHNKSAVPRPRCERSGDGLVKPVSRILALVSRVSCGLERHKRVFVFW